jgi:hypothetical protein
MRLSTRVYSSVPYVYQSKKAILASVYEDPYGEMLKIGSHNGEVVSPLSPRKIPGTRFC